MTRFYYTLLVLLLMIVNQSFGQFIATRVDESTVVPKGEGLFYSLPRTGINIDIQVKKIDKIKGPYSEFAEKFLGLTQVINVNSTEYEITSIRLSEFNEPDPSNFYFIQLAGKQKDREKLDLLFSELGCLSFSGAISSAHSHKNGQELDTQGIDIPDILNPGAVDKVDTLVRKISADTTIEQKIIKKVTTTKTTEQKAKEAADFILKLDESMFNLINGYQEVSYEKGTMEFMYRQMEKQKSEYLELFKGITAEQTESFSFRIIPQGKNDNITNLCKFSLNKGITDKSSVGGDLVQLEVISSNNLAPVRVSIEQRNADVKTDKGLYYRIPEKADVLVKIGGQVKLESEFIINQFGIVTYLPSTSLRNVEVFDNTGGLKHLIIN